METVTIPKASPAHARNGFRSVLAASGRGTLMDLMSPLASRRFGKASARRIDQRRTFAATNPSNVTKVMILRAIVWRIPLEETAMQSSS